MKSIEAVGLCRDYPQRGAAARRALDRLDLCVDAGEVHGLLGPNGAGKTTLIKILSTVLTPTAGEARVCGFDVVVQPREVRQRIGLVLGGERGLYTRLSGRQNIEFWAALYGYGGRAAARRVADALESVGLAQRADAAVATYSRGMKQRLHLARSLIADASVLIFDEPTIGMDPVGAASFRAIVQALRAVGKAILLATHDMDEATQLCARVSLIDKGRILAVSSPAQLVANTALSSSLVFECADRQAAEALRAADGVKGFAELDPAAHRYRCSVESDRLIPALYSRLLALGATGLTVVQPSLEDVYLEMFRDGRNA